MNFFGLPYSFRYILLLCICLSFLRLPPVDLVHAELVTRMVDNALIEWNRGSFQRTEMATLQNTDLSAQDLEGAVQIAPLGLLRDWFNSPFTLPRIMTGMGATAIGDRIYVMGGNTPTQQEPLSEVWSVAVDTETGLLLPDSSASNWRAEPDLPAVQASIKGEFDTPFTHVSNPAVTSVDNPSGNDYIYVIGGSVVQNTYEFSSFGVRIGVVGSNGRITEWLEGPEIPDQNGEISFRQRGLQSASAISMKINGKTYIYILGGLQRYLEGTYPLVNIKEEGSPKIFYAQVGANGQLFKPSNPSEAGWEVLEDNIPLVRHYPEASGVWGAVAVGGRFVAAGGEAIYLMGGQVRVQGGGSTAQYSERVYRARVNSDGTLDWSGWDGTLPSSRLYQAGVEHNGNIYLTGGRQGNLTQPDKKVLNSYVKDDFSLPSFGDAQTGSSFLPNDALPRPRMLHGSVVVSTDKGYAFVYVIGGLGDGTDAFPEDDNGTNAIIYGKVGGLDEDEKENLTYAPDGWYYSDALEIILDKATVQEISWITAMEQSGMDIAVDYRTSQASDCELGPWTEWNPLADPGAAPRRSKHGVNAAEVGSPETRCFQYRARLTTANNAFTPSLLNVSLKLEIPGSPDLKVNSLTPQFSTDGRSLLDFTVTIINQNDSEPTIPVFAVNAGSFYVDLCVFGPDETVQMPTIPFEPNQQCSDAYTLVSSRTMEAGTTYLLPATRWYSTVDNQPLNILDLFDTAGDYTVMAIVDSLNYIGEGREGTAENNNITQTSFSLAAPHPVLPGDTFEVDDICSQARAIATDGTIQEHTFHQAGDEDWVQFDAVAGQSYRLNAAIPSGSPADVILEVYPRCAEAPAASQDPSFSPSARLEFQAPTSGPLFLRLRNHTPAVAGAEVAYTLSVVALQSEAEPGALIIVAGRLKAQDRLQPNITHAADTFYTVFQNQGYTADHIYYLTTDLTRPGADALPTAANVETAITAWAQSRVGTDRPLTLYLMDHGNPDVLYLDEPRGQRITPDQVHRWLQQVEAAHPGLAVNVIIEACYSGSFLNRPESISHPGRVIITSTGATNLAYASPQGALFSDHFGAALNQGQNLYESFQRARTAVQAVYPVQTPWLDSDGDGIPNEVTDGWEAQRRGFTAAGTFAATLWPPYIEQALPPTRVTAGQGVIQARVLDDGTVQRVWAEIYPPGYQPPEATSELVQPDLPTVELVAQDDGWYRANYAGFQMRGTYRVVVYAEDTQGITAQPVALELSTGAEIFLPLVVR
jgi:hypothetical protein